MSLLSIKSQSPCRLTYLLPKEQPVHPISGHRWLPGYEAAIYIHRAACSVAGMAAEKEADAARDFFCRTEAIVHIGFRQAFTGMLLVSGKAVCH